MKKSLMITVPFLNDIGGTEIEAVSTAVILWDSGLFNRVNIFIPWDYNRALFADMIGERSIKLKKYPVFFSTKAIKLINRFFNKCGLKINLSEFLYWKYHNYIFQIFFILTYTRSNYFFPIIQHSFKGNKYVIKITMYQFEKLKSYQYHYYKASENVIVFNENQKHFWEGENKLKNIIALDTMIPNELNLLALELPNFKKNSDLILGYMGRISKEKNIEEMILLLDFLNNENHLSCKLFIQGDGNAEYVGQILTLIETLNLSKAVFFKNEFLDPMRTQIFFKDIHIFLVTSLHEGGPMTALEAVAAGRIILGYNIGAMAERFGEFALLINDDFESLCNSALAIAKLEVDEKSKLANDLRKHYILNLRNDVKCEELLEILN